MKTYQLNRQQVANGRQSAFEKVRVAKAQNKGMVQTRCEVK
ncbi:hypothetical protein VCHA53O463_400001 [Vibrio chagasii]|nr:hypothetical protein VCHA43P275_310011 [Vibrio chagasii]CAH7287799.1 hypothetical protein VCHA53O473_340029 [Vibrio chagasii]CAH7340611.1 hypothetical protein VCHA53O463_400001 [Vibrio chagasii]